MTPSDSPDPAVGDPISPLQVAPTPVQLFAFSAVTWNSHRIHYDQAYTRTEGSPDVLVQSHLHAAFLARAVTTSFGPGTRVKQISWQNRGPAVPGDELTVTGRVTAVAHRDGETWIDLELEERNQRDELCVRGWATVRVTEKSP